MRKTTLHLGLDVHKDSITLAVAEGRRNGEVRIHSTISNDLHALEKLSRRQEGQPRNVLAISWKAQNHLHG